MYGHFNRIQGLSGPNGAKSIIRIEYYARFETSNSCSTVAVSGSERLLRFQPKLYFNVVWKLP